MLEQIGRDRGGKRVVGEREAKNRCADAPERSARLALELKVECDDGVVREVGGETSSAGASVQDEAIRIAGKWQEGVIPKGPVELASR